MTTRLFKKLLVLFAVFGVLWELSFAESINIPLSNVKSPNDIIDQLPPILDAPDAPDGFNWAGYGGDINISTSILFPYEGQTVDNMFEVMLEIAAHPLGAFKEKYMGAYQCIEVDSSPPACWSLFDKSPIPRLHLNNGPHILRSAISDPTGEWILPQSWGPIRNIVVSVESVVPTQTEESETAEEPMDQEPPVKMEIPIMKVVSPPEMGIITTRLVDMQYQVVIRSRDDFKEHFQTSYVCGRLSIVHVSYCWSIYKTDAMPRWVGLDDGFYTLQGSYVCYLILHIYEDTFDI
mmetsp:Transcript_26232/g.34122  ORF Transcript_26232/g.34122 Transcript_26232/m.34122 type:complete len:292 (-) Transcript_26232:115-990(-)